MKKKPNRQKSKRLSELSIGEAVGKQSIFLAEMCHGTSSVQEENQYVTQ